jgi:hypothetical protein
MEILRNHPLFPSDFGIDIFITTVAAAERARIREAMLGLKLHESTTKYLDPESSLIPMFRQVVTTMFELAVYYSHRNERPAKTDIIVSDYYGPIPITVEVNREKMLETVATRYDEYQEIFEKILPEEILNITRKFPEGNVAFDAKKWAICVWYLFQEYSKTKNDTLIDALRVLWLARFVEFYNECKDMNFIEAETAIRENAGIFVDLKCEILKKNS